MSKHRAPRLPRRPRPSATFVRRALACSACATITGAAVVVGVVTTSQAQPGTAQEPVTLDAAAQPVEATETVEVPPEVTRVTRFAPPATLEDTSGASRFVPARVDDVAEQSVEDIPAAATAAYQRSETVIGAARRGCHLDWTLLAAIALVESDHGRVDGGDVGPSGVVRPSRFGKPLDGKRGRQKVRDTDGGTIDGLRRWDRTVGAFNFLPTTWNVVGVDGDGDGRRDPQDLDDAALGAAVLLCANGDDLATDRGVARALRNVSRAPGYARTVLDRAAAYVTELDEIATSAPAVVELPGTVGVVPGEDPRSARRDPEVVPDDEDRPRGRDRGEDVDLHAPSTPPGRGPRGPRPPRPGGGSSPTPTPTPDPTPTPTPTPDPSPTGSPSQSPSPSQGPTPSPEPEPTPEAEPTPTPPTEPETCDPEPEVEPGVEPVVEPVVEPEPGEEPAVEPCAGRTED